MDFIVIRANDSYFKTHYDFEMSILNFDHLMEKLNHTFQIPGGDCQVPLHVLFENVEVKSTQDLVKVFQLTRSRGEYVLNLDVDYGFEPTTIFKTTESYDIPNFDTMKQSDSCPTSADLSTTLSLKNNTFHNEWEIPCSMCHTKIVGVLFKCLHCSKEVNLCESCESQNHPCQAHVVVKIRHPSYWENFKQTHFRGGDEFNSVAGDDKPLPIRSTTSLPESFDQLLINQSIEWNLTTPASGSVAVDNLFQQTWRLSSKGGIHWPKKALRIIAIKKLISQEQTLFSGLFLDSLQCWSNVQRRCDTGQLMCSTFCSMNLPNKLASVGATPVPKDVVVVVDWHICTDGWPPRPLCQPMQTEFVLRHESTGRWNVGYKSAISPAQAKCLPPAVVHSSIPPPKEDDTVQFVETQTSLPDGIALPFELSVGDITATPNNSSEEATEFPEEFTLSDDILGGCPMGALQPMEPTTDWIVIPPNDHIQNEEEILACDADGNKVLASLLQNNSPFSDSMFKLNLDTNGCSAPESTFGAVEATAVSDANTNTPTVEFSDNCTVSSPTIQAEADELVHSALLEQTEWIPTNQPNHMYQYTSTTSMNELFKMGFYDRALNQSLLNKYEDDLPSVVNELLNLQ